MNHRTKAGAAIAAAALCFWACRATPRVSAAYDLEMGRVLVYRFDYSSHSETDVSRLLDRLRHNESGSVSGAGLAQSFETRITGDLVMTVVERAEVGYRLALKIKGPAVALTVNGRPEPLQAEIIGAALGLDVIAEMSPEGRFVSVAFDPDVDSACRNYARALMGMVQVVLAGKMEPGRKAGWECREDDPGGAYVARYVPLPGRARELSRRMETRVEVFQKAKLRYLTQPATAGSGGGQRVETRVPEGTLEAVFDVARGRLAALKGEETQTVSISGTVVSRVASAIDMSFDGEEAAPPEVIARLRELREERLMSSPPDTLAYGLSEIEQKTATERSVLGQDTLETLLESLSRLENEKEPETTPLYLKFRAHVYLHPESCAVLAARISAAKSGSAAQQILVGALSSVGTGPAQAVLVGLLKDGLLPAQTAMLIIQALGLSRKPATLETQAAVAEMAAKASDPEVASVATLALGMMANRLMPSEPARAEGLVKALMADIGRSDSKERTRLLLLALGNSGSDLAFPVFRQYLKDDAATLRSVAAAGLRWVQAPGTDDLLAGALTGDPEPSVRTEAAFALGFREPTPATLKALVESFKDDESVVVRLTVLRDLWDNARDNPEVLALIREAARADRSPEVKKAAADFISSLTPEKNAGL